MLVYCFEAVPLPFDVAAAALVSAIGAIPAEKVRLEFDDGNRESCGSAGVSTVLEFGPAGFGQPSFGSAQLSVPVEWGVQNSWLTAGDGVLTLSQVGPALCHLSLNGSVTGRLAPGLLYNRAFQMAVELAAGALVLRLAEATLLLAPVDRTAGDRRSA